MLRRSFLQHTRLGLKPLPIITTTLDDLTLHAVNCGWVKVKRSHHNPSAGAPVILLDPFWTQWLPIWVWVVQHPEGIIVVDTGENQRVTDRDYFDGEGVNGWVNKRILRFAVEESFEIGKQLLTIGIHPDQVRWVVLTHLHLDHTDGLKHFPKAEILVSRTELARPYGALPCTFPAWFRPRKVDYTKPDRYFSNSYPLTADGRVVIVPTNGHSYGHQSVLLRTPALDVLLAGDTTFTEQQLLRREVAGICVDKQAARRTLEAIYAYCRQRPTVYLPTHDPEAGQRLKNGLPVKQSLK